MINLLLMNRKFTSFLLVCILSTSVAFAQKVLIGNVYYKLSAADHTAGVTFESRDSAANYANVTLAGKDIFCSALLANARGSMCVTV